MIAKILKFYVIFRPALYTLCVCTTFWHHRVIVLANNYMINYNSTNFVNVEFWWCLCHFLPSTMPDTLYICTCQMYVSILYCSVFYWNLHNFYSMQLTVKIFILSIITQYIYRSHTCMPVWSFDLKSFHCLKSIDFVLSTLIMFGQFVAYCYKRLKDQLWWQT